MPYSAHHLTAEPTRDPLDPLIAPTALELGMRGAVIAKRPRR